MNARDAVSEFNKGSRPGISTCLAQTAAWMPALRYAFVGFCSTCWVSRKRRFDNVGLHKAEYPRACARRRYGCAQMRTGGAPHRDLRRNGRSECESLPCVSVCAYPASGTEPKLGIKTCDEVKKEHWTRIKALNRRFAEEWDNEYDNLRPVADVLARLQEGVSHWLDNQAVDTLNQSADERNSTYTAIRQHVSRRLHDWIIARMSYESLTNWQDAYEHRGTGSTFIRAREIAAIYEATAPTIRAAMTIQAREFRSALRQIVQEAVESTGGQIR